MRPINQCFNQQLAHLCQRSIQLEDLSKKIAQFLPSELAAQCQVGSFNKGCLILNTTDAIWASQLRYAALELRDTLRKEAGLYQLISIKIAISPPLEHYKNNVPQSSHELSEKAKALIIEESQNCTYEPLQHALLHLAGEE